VAVAAAWELEPRPDDLDDLCWRSRLRRGDRRLEEVFAASEVDDGTDSLLLPCFRLDAAFGLPLVSPRVFAGVVGGERSNAEELESESSIS